MHSGVFFDLDDTLYPQSKDVLQRIEAVDQQFAIGEDAVCRWKAAWLEQGNMSRRLIDDLIDDGVLPDKKDSLLAAYRAAPTRLQLGNELVDVMKRLRNEHCVFVVTNGNRAIQGHKVEALGLRDLTNDVFIAYDEHAKPSPHWINFAIERFNLAREKCVFFGNDRATDGASAAAARIEFRLTSSRDVRDDIHHWKYA